MAEKLFIYIKDPEAEKFAWCLWDDASQTAPETKQDTIETIASHNHFNEVVVIISGLHVYTTTTSIPSTNMAQIKKAIPFAVEEELAEDIDRVHFSVGPINKDKTISVAVINNDVMDACLERLNELSVQPSYFIPDFYSATHIENTWSVCVEKEMSQIRTGEYTGYVVQTAQLMELLELTLKTLEYPPSEINLFNFAGEALPELKEKTIHNIPVNIQTMTTGFFEYTCQNILKQPFINLLQGPYKMGVKFAKAKKAWVLAGCVFAVWAIISFSGAVASHFYYSHQKAKLQKQIDSIYMDVFPQSTTIVSPQLRIQREIDKYRRASSDGGFLMLLGKVGAVLQKESSIISLESLSFQNDNLVFSVKTSSFQNLQQLSKALERNAFKFDEYLFSAALADAAGVLV